VPKEKKPPAFELPVPVPYEAMGAFSRLNKCQPTKVVSLLQVGAPVDARLSKLWLYVNAELVTDTVAWAEATAARATAATKSLEDMRDFSGG
jgi:hypothetical protein